MENKIEILKTPKIIGQEYRKFKKEDKVLQELINIFTQVLEANLKEENLMLFYNNISTLEIENRSILIQIIIGKFRDNTVTGQYYLDDNIISILPLKNRNFLNKYIGITLEEYIANLYHELLHMSSTIVDKQSTITFSGFSQIGGNTNIGVSLDDGYTELILYRYFNIKEEYISFDYEVVVANLIEEIIGKEKMIDLYFKADLYNLVYELQKYNTRENIIKFLEDLDSIYVLEDYKKRNKKDIIYYHNEISSFLVKAYLNKLKLYLQENKISNSEYNTKLDKYLDSIHIAFEKLEAEETKKRTRRNIF